MYAARAQLRQYLGQQVACASMRYNWISFRSKIEMDSQLKLNCFNNLLMNGSKVLNDCTYVRYRSVREVALTECQTLP
jgi:hypothetical protein